MKMRPISEIVDDCLEKMKPHKLFSWEDWWTDVVKDGPTPSNKTYAYWVWIRKRNDIKQEADKELARRKRPERFICPGCNQGIYLVGKEDVAEIKADVRVRKIVNCFITAHKEMFQLSLSSGLSDVDKKMLERVSSLVELQQNTMIGTLAKMRSLPPATKKKLLKHLGVEA